MRTSTKSTSYGFAAYLVLLLGFVAMGLFIFSLAIGFGSAPSWPFGAAMVVFFVASIGLFRRQITLAEKSRLSGDVLISSDPMTPALRRTDVEQYERTYRGHRAQPAEKAGEGTRLRRVA